MIAIAIPLRLGDRLHVQTETTLLHVAENRLRERNKEQRR